jgi:guanylate kinase
MSKISSNKYALLPILVIIGPSAAGKSTVIRQLVNQGLILVNPTWTTRPPRPGEIMEGVEHRFVSQKLFHQKQKEGYFHETVQMFGLPYHYGLPPVIKSTSRKPSLVMLRVSLLPLFNKYYPVNIVYQIEDSLPRIRKRLIARQLKGEKIGTRLEDYKKEIEAGRKKANRIFVNKNTDLLALEIKAALKEDFQSL